MLWLQKLSFLVPFAYFPYKYQIMGQKRPKTRNCRIIGTNHLKKPSGILLGSRWRHWRLLDARSRNVPDQKSRTQWCTGKCQFRICITARLLHCTKEWKYWRGFHAQLWTRPGKYITQTFTSLHNSHGSLIVPEYGLAHCRAASWLTEKFHLTSKSRKSFFNSNFPIWFRSFRTFSHFEFWFWNLDLVNLVSEILTQKLSSQHWEFCRPACPYRAQQRGSAVQK